MDGSGCGRCAARVATFTLSTVRLLNQNQWYQVRPRSTTPGLKKSGNTSLCCKLLPNSARHIGFSISHRGPKIHNPRTQVLYVVPQPTQPTVVPDTHALVGVVPSTTSQRNTTPKRAARPRHGLTSSTAPTVGEVEVLVRPPRSTPESRTSYYLRVSERPVDEPVRVSTWLVRIRVRVS